MNLSCDLEADTKDDSRNLSIKPSQIAKSKSFLKNKKDLDLISFYAMESNSDLNKIYNARNKKINKVNKKVLTFIYQRY